MEFPKGAVNEASREFFYPFGGTTIQINLSRYYQFYSHAAALQPGADRFYFQGVFEQDAA
jgi:hypothetical protein